VSTNGTERKREAEALEERWAREPRWQGIKRDYAASDVIRLRSSLKVSYTVAEAGAQRLWSLLNNDDYVATFGALTGAQAVQMIRAGLKAIYVSGWQVAADANLSANTYPDQSLYPSNSTPALVKRLNNALTRADQISNIQNNGSGHQPGKNGVYWYAPIVADAEAGFGGPIHAFELMKSMIEAGAAGVHFEDQLAAEKKCGHLGGKVLIPTSQFVRTLNAARLAADVLDVPTLVVARTDALNATLLTSDIDPADGIFATGERTQEGYYRTRDGLDSAVARGLAYAPYSDMLWCETSEPDIGEAREFADAIHSEFPGKLLAYNCSPSFNWKAHMSDSEIADFRRQLTGMGYKFQFITLAGWHMVNLNAFELAKEFNERGMSAYVEIQEQEFAREADGYTAARHQQEVGTGYFDEVLMSVTGGESSTAALAGSTESAQFG
jgi:isocitrate lyase